MDAPFPGVLWYCLRHLPGFSRIQGGIFLWGEGVASEVFFDLFSPDRGTGKRDALSWLFGVGVRAVVLFRRCLCPVKGRGEAVEACQGRVALVSLTHKLSLWS